MKSTLEGKRAGFNRNLSRHGHETEEDSVAFRERSAQAMHLFNVESLAACFHELDGTKAVGIDGITKAQYGEHLEENLHDLVERDQHLRVSGHSHPLRPAQPAQSA